jgi:hypothetical protein
MQIGEKSTTGIGSSGRLDRRGASDEDVPVGRLRIWIVDPRYVVVKLNEPLEYKVIADSGRVIASGTVEENGYFDIEPPEIGRISLWLDGELLTVHDAE